MPLEMARQGRSWSELEVESAAMKRGASSRGAGTVHYEGPDEEDVAGSHLDGVGVRQTLWGGQVVDGGVSV